MYEAIADPYCYAGTTVLKNKLGLKDQAQLSAFEAEITNQRASEPLPTGRFGFGHYRAIHRHLFQDVYEWAGKIRTVRISKGGNAFCFPENIKREVKKLFSALTHQKHLQGLDRSTFSKKAAHFLAEMNAIHPFREGNGRVQLSFLILLAERAGHPLDLDRLDPKAILTATVASFDSDEAELAEIIKRLID